MVWFDYMLNRLQQEDVSKIEEYFDLSPGEEQPLSIWVFGRPAAGKTTTAAKSSKKTKEILRKKV